MATTNLQILFILLFAALLIQGAETHSQVAQGEGGLQSYPSQRWNIEMKRDAGRRKWRSRRREMIGSTPPTCTYNECRGCKFKCRAEQIPVDGNDPINSAYHYKCVCRR